MIRPVGHRASRLAATVCASLFFLLSVSAAKETSPYRVALAVRWGAGAGSDAFREDLSRSLTEALASRCFARIAPAGPNFDAEGAELVFDVVLTGVVDETRFDDSIARALQPGEPAEELRRVTYFAVTVDAALTARLSGALVSRKHLVAHVSRRPVYVGEDSRATARAEAIDNIVHDLARALGCGGDKLTRKIRAALVDRGSDAPEPR
jgi:hypothetical protein